MKRELRLMLLSAAVLNAHTALADADGQESSYLDEIIVTATREEERVFDVPVSVSVITQEEIQRTETSSLRELFRYVPGVDLVRDRRSRAGEANVEIRGLGGRRVGCLRDYRRRPPRRGARLHHAANPTTLGS